MRIGIDARLYGPLDKGIGRYTQKIIQQLEELDRQNEYFIFLRPAGFELAEELKPNLHKILADYPPYSLKEQISLPLKLKKYRLDLVHFPHFNVPIFYSGKFVITIHDLIHRQFNLRATTRFWPFYFLKYLFSQLITFLAIKRATRILTVSEFVKNQIIGYYKINPNKIIVTYEAANMVQKIQNSEFKIQNSEFLLYIGNAYPHKNLERLLSAFKLVLSSIRYPASGIQLVLVGKIDYFYKRLQKLAKELKIEDKVIFTGSVSDEELVNLYQNALAYISPSLMEGFGLPGLEAMAQGCPVISSNAGPLPEIYGQAALYFNPNDINEMAEKIKEIIAKPDLREKLKKLGLEQVKKFSWTKCAEKTLEVYQLILKNN
ncbi:MAG: glycosyltransferase family 4 protein [Patescibacteria group bacterium]